MNRKQRVIKALRELPDTAILDDIEDKFWRYGYALHEHEELGLD